MYVYHLYRNNALADVHYQTGTLFLALTIAGQVSILSASRRHCPSVFAPLHQQPLTRLANLGPDDKGEISADRRLLKHRLQASHSSQTIIGMR